MGAPRALGVESRTRRSEMAAFDPLQPLSFEGSCRSTLSSGALRGFIAQRPLERNVRSSGLVMLPLTQGVTERQQPFGAPQCHFQ